MPNHHLRVCPIMLLLAACNGRPGLTYHGDLRERADRVKSSSPTWECDTTFMSLGLEAAPPFLRCAGRSHDSAVAVVSDTLGRVLSVVTETSVNEQQALQVFQAWRENLNREFGSPVPSCNPGGFDSASVWKGRATHAILGLKLGEGLVHRVVSLGPPVCPAVSARP